MAEGPSPQIIQHNPPQTNNSVTQLLQKTSQLYSHSQNHLKQNSPLPQPEHSTRTESPSQQQISHENGEPNYQHSSQSKPNIRFQYTQQAVPDSCLSLSQDSRLPQQISRFNLPFISHPYYQRPRRGKPINFQFYGNLAGQNPPPLIPYGWQFRPPPLYRLSPSNSQGSQQQSSNRQTNHNQTSISPHQSNSCPPLISLDGEEGEESYQPSLTPVNHLGPDAQHYHNRQLNCSPSGRQLSQSMQYFPAKYQNLCQNYIGSEIYPYPHILSSHQSYYPGQVTIQSSFPGQVANQYPFPFPHSGQLNTQSPHPNQIFQSSKNQPLQPDALGHNEQNNQSSSNDFSPYLPSKGSASLHRMKLMLNKESYFQSPQPYQEINNSGLHSFPNKTVINAGNTLRNARSGSSASVYVADGIVLSPGSFKNLTPPPTPPVSFPNQTIVRPEFPVIRNEAEENADPLEGLGFSNLESESQSTIANTKPNDTNKKISSMNVTYSSHLQDSSTSRVTPTAKTPPSHAYIYFTSSSLVPMVTNHSLNEDVESQVSDIAQTQSTVSGTSAISNSHQLDAFHEAHSQFSSSSQSITADYNNKSLPTFSLASLNTESDTTEENKETENYYIASGTVSPDVEIPCYVCDGMIIHEEELKLHLLFGQLSCQYCGHKIVTCDMLPNGDVEESCRDSETGYHGYSMWPHDVVQYLSKYIKKELIIENFCKDVHTPPSDSEILEKFDSYLAKIKVLRFSSPWKFALLKCEQYILLEKSRLDELAAVATVENEITEPVDTTVDSEVSEPIDAVAKSEVTEPVDATVESEVTEPIDATVDSEVTEPIDATVDSEVTEPVDTTAKSEITKPKRLVRKKSKRKKDPFVIVVPADNRYLLIHVPGEDIPENCPECYNEICPSQFSVNAKSYIMNYICDDCNLPVYVVPQISKSQVIIKQAS